MEASGYNLQCTQDRPFAVVELDV